MIRFSPVVVALSLLMTSALFAQVDQGWLRLWEEAQRQRPRTIATVARIAPQGEPGTPLVVHGRVVQRDGKTPAPNVIVFAYHTDATGVYNRRGARGYRLRGWAKTDANGRFEFHTIRPAAYPNRREEAHIHLTIEGPNLPRRWVPDINFAGDPLLSAEDKRRSSAAGAFGSIRPVTTRGGVQHVDFNIRVEEESKF